MSATEITAAPTTIPAGTYRLDPVHSSAGFAVKHMVVATFRGRFENFDATLTVDEDGSASLTGAVAGRLDRGQGREPEGPPRLARVLRRRALPGDPLRGLADRRSAHGRRS